MPFARPTLSALQSQVASDIATALPGADALLRFSNLNIAGMAQAGLANLHYGYLDWIAKQAVPFTCTDEFLEGWAGLKGVLRNLATSASGVVSFTGIAGTTIPSGAIVVRGDGINFVTTGATTISGLGTGAAPVTALADPSGLTGAFGNTAVGITMTLSQSITGVQSNGSVSTALTGGADLESNDSLRNRMLIAFQAPPQGGDQNDYVTWALQVPGVTRAWCVANGFGPGTIVVFVMLDTARAAFGGFPQGSKGVATAESRDVDATGDQLAVANAIYAVQAAVGLVYVVAPVANTISFAVHGVPAALQSAATAAIAGVFLAQGSPGGTIPFGNVWSAIANVAGGNYFSVAPTVDIVCAAGQIPVLGTVTYT